MHQLVEYLIGAAFIAQGVQSPKPLIPVVLGGLVLVNAAIAVGPMAAYRLIAPPVHRLLDYVLIALIVLGAALGPSLDSSTRIMLAMFAAAMAFVSWQSSYATKARSAPIAPGANSGSADRIGRIAGRAVGSGVNSYRRRRR